METSLERTKDGEKKGVLRHWNNQKQFPKNYDLQDAHPITIFLQKPYLVFVIPWRRFVPVSFFKSISRHLLPDLPKL